jgi:exonuclease SbcD
MLHTSDWHLGRTLGRLKRRHEEHGRFLDWLLGLIEAEGVDVLLVAGDVFDSVAPPVEAQALYYGFLGSVARSRCRHVVISSGNHDSASFLAAPSGLLRHLGVHVAAEPTGDPADEILELKGPDGAAELIVAAVPFLRDRWVRSAVEGESIEERDRRLAEGVRDHYARAAHAAEARRAGRDIPVVATGHLFAKGGRAHEGDGVREAYAGALSRVDTGAFPPAFSYVALGHLHSAQGAGPEWVRYSGSPIRMGFGEPMGPLGAKSVELLDLSPGGLARRPVPIPTFQELLTLEGDLDALRAGLGRLREAGSSAWLELIYTGAAPLGDPGPLFGPLLRGTRMEVLLVRDRSARAAALKDEGSGRPLREYTEEEVFERAMAAHGVGPEGARGLRETFGLFLSLFRDSGGDPALAAGLLGGDGAAARAPGAPGAPGRGAGDGPGGQGGGGS